MGLAPDKTQKSEPAGSPETDALNRLHRACMKLRKARSIKDGLDVILEAAVELTGACKGIVQLFDSAGQALSIAAHQGIDDEFHTHFRTVGVRDESACGRALDTLRCVVIPDVKKDFLFSAHLAAAQDASYQAVISQPLLNSDRKILGILSVYFATPHHPQYAELDALELYADQAASFIEQWRMGDAILERDLKLELFIRHSSAPVAMLDHEMRYLAASERYLTFYRVGERQIIGKSHYDVFGNLDHRWIQAHQRALKGEVVTSEEDCYITHDGVPLWISWEVRPWFRADAAIGGIVLTTVDITQRKKAEQRFFTVVQAVPEILLLVDESLKIGFANKAAELQFGMTASELQGLPIKTLLLNTVRILRSYWRSVSRGGSKVSPESLRTVHEIQVRTSGGELHSADLKISECDSIEKKFILLSVTVTEERKKAETAMRELRGILDNSAESVVVTGMDGCLVSWNRAADELFGIAESASKGLNSIERLVPEDRQAEFDAHFRSVLAGETVEPHETERLTKGERTIPVKVTMFPLKDEKGIVSYVVSILQDESVTAKMRRKVEESSRLASLGEMTAIVAHEVRNPLQSMMLNLQHLRDVLGDSKKDGLKSQREELAKLSQDLQIEARRMKRLMDKCLFYSRLPKPKNSKVDLRQIVKKGVRIVQPQALSLRVQVAVDQPAFPLRVLGDQEQILQVLLNLLSNALEASPEGGIIKVAIEKDSDGFCRFSVCDQGCSLSSGSEEKLFKPFYTTKVQGAGLGLFISRRIVEEHGGTLVYSKQNTNGACFTASLPAFQMRKPGGSCQETMQSSGDGDSGGSDV